MRGMVFCLVLVAGCASKPPTTTVVAPAASSAAMAAGAGAKPASSAGAANGVGAGSNPAQTAGGGTNAGSAAGAGVGNAAPTAGARVVADDAAGRPVNRALVAQGYRPTSYHGQLFYCRKQKLTGSQFTQKVCLTEHEADLQERIAQDEMNKRNWGGKCLPPLCPPTK